MRSASSSVSMHRIFTDGGTTDEGIEEKALGAQDDPPARPTESDEYGLAELGLCVLPECSFMVLFVLSSQPIVFVP